MEGPMTPDPVIALTELKSRLSPADWKTICDYVLAERELMEAYAAKRVAEALAACPAATSMHGCPSYRPEPRHD